LFLKMLISIKQLKWAIKVEWTIMAKVKGLKDLSP
jgi:hypothetical protein